MAEETFDFTVRGIPYDVKISTFDFNSEKRYRVAYNGGPTDTFAWDSEMKRLRAIDLDASTLPDDLEMAISERIEQMGY